MVGVEKQCSSSFSLYLVGGGGMCEEILVGILGNSVVWSNIYRET